MAETLLTREQRSRYMDDGFLELPMVFSSQEAHNWSDECDRLWEAAANHENDPRIQYRDHREKGKVPDRFDAVIDRSPFFRELAHDERLLDHVRSLLGADVVLLKDKLITKRPGTMGYGMHQDYPYWAFLDVPADAILTAQISIDGANETNGALELFPSLHHDRLAAPADEPMDVDESKMDLSGGRIIETHPGDVLLFHSLTPHRSGPNTSTHSRRALFFTYTTAEHRAARDRLYARG